MGATKKNGSYFNTCSMALMLILHKIQENVRLSFVINCEFEFYGFKHFKIMYVETFPHLILLTPQPIFFSDCTSLASEGMQRRKGREDASGIARPWLSNALCRAD